MTIAAGFPCKNGLVLCADTQETVSGYVKTDTGKIRVLSTPRHHIVFTGAGDSDLIDTAIDEMSDAVRAENPEGLTRVAAVLKKTMLRVFEESVKPYAAFPLDDRPSITLLVGIQSAAATVLYKASGTSFRLLQNAECIGYGLALGKSLTKQIFKEDMTVEHAGLTAVYVLQQAKRWVDGCGGNSDIVVLSNDGNVLQMSAGMVNQLEKHFDEFNRHLRPIIIACADRDVEDKKFNEMMDDFDYQLRRLRGRFTSDMFGLLHGSGSEEAFLSGFVPKKRERKKRSNPTPAPSVPNQTPE
jgi:20S proteasome alpha/beta subunit